MIPQKEAETVKAWGSAGQHIYLEKTESSRFSERRFLKKESGEQVRRAPELCFWPTHPCQVGTYVYTHFGVLGTC